MEATMEQVKFDETLVDGIRQHAQRECDKGGYEAVGFLLRKPGSSVISSQVHLNNHSATPDTSFFVEPWEQFRAEKKIKANGYEIVGVYHSHPISEAMPSGADRNMARPGELMAIFSVAFDELRVWREGDGELVEVEVVPS